MDSYICRQVNYLIIPFAFNIPYEEAILNTKNRDWVAKNYSTHRLFQHINHLVLTTDKYQETIGRRFVLEQTGRKRHQLPNNITSEFSLAIDDKELCKVSIPSLELLLFETQVGFLVYELKYHKNSSIDDIIYGNYYCKKIHLNNCRLKYTKRVENTDICVTTTLNDLTCSILKDFDVSTFFENNSQVNESPRPFQALVYSAVILDHSFVTEQENYKELIGDYLFKMRRSFKDSYKPTAHEFDLNKNKDILHLFENSYWGISLEGLANISHMVGDKTTNDFFSGSYYGYLKNTYLYIYILALHQRYALLQLSIEASQLSREDPVLSLREKIAYFTLRSLFLQVSNVSHHGRLYEVISKSLGIKGLWKELHLELEMLSSICSLKETKETARIREEEIKQKEVREEKENRLSIFILVLSIFFVVFSTTADVWTIYLNIQEGRYPSPGSTYFFIFGGVLALLWTGVLSAVFYYYKVIKENSTR